MALNTATAKYTTNLLSKKARKEKKRENFGLKHVLECRVYVRCG
jgi:hypothetical protein